jgi:hypothetical protein
MPVAAGISAAGSLGGSLMSYLGSQGAAGKISGMGGQAISALESMFNTAQGALNPFISAGQGVLPALSKLLTPGPSQTSTLQNLPGFQFQSQYGTMAATNALAARGLGGSSGPLGTAISNYNQGLAGTSFGNLTGMLQNYANMGSGAAGSLAQAAGQAGGNLASTFTSLGNSLAQTTMGGFNAIGSGISGGANSIANYLALGPLIQKLMGGGGGGGGAYQVAPGADQ